MTNSDVSPKIHDIFYREIEREITQVVQVDNDDPDVVSQELREYILTPQLERHFSDALGAINKSKHQTTEEIGMWISGFFGSGKSHFMKTLGYVLQNRSVGGQTAAEVFKDRCDDAMLSGEVDKVISNFDSEVLMFQIGAKADASGSDSITEIIHREFNKSRGYASIPWVARMEQELDSRGIYDEFIQAVEEETGKDWSEARQDAVFVRSDMATALMEASDEFQTKQEAEKAIEDVEGSIVITPASLATKISDYIEDCEQETGQDHRYFVFIDEISQFIGDDDQRLLELQSLVEEFSQKGGSLFLGVTSQEQLHELIPGVLEKEDLQSKVIDRFPHSFDLISENLDKVVRDRILRKKGEYKPPLRNLYEENEGILSARYKLESGRSLRTINEENFVECYPFLPYQLDILPEIFAALRGRGSDDRLTGRERTLIAVTQSILKDGDLLYGEELGSVVTLDLIFDEIREEVPDSDERSIEEADPEGGDSELAKRILKSLYLLQQLEWIPNTAENIATTLQERIGPTHSLESEVEETLDALVQAGYVGRSEEGYRFLRETERKLENEVKGVKIRSGDIRRASKRDFLEDVLDDTKRTRYQNQSFHLTVHIDGEELSSGGYLDLHTFSPIHQLYEDIDEGQLKTKSHDEPDQIYWIANDEDADQIQADLKSILQIQTILKEKRGDQLSPEEQEAVNKKQQDLQRLRASVRRALRESFQTGRIIYYGNDKDLDERDTGLGSILQSTTKEAIPRVFTKLDDGLASVEDRHLRKIFDDLDKSSTPAVFGELGVVKDGDLIAEARIASEVEDEIEQRERNGDDRTGGDLVNHFSQPPYGWNRNVVRLATAVLFRNGSITPTYKERTYGNYKDDGAQDLFTQVSKFKHTSFEVRETVDPQTRTEAKQLLDKLFDRKVRTTDQAVNEGLKEEANQAISTLSSLIPQLRRVDFPHLDTAEQLKDALESLLDQSTPAKRIKTFVQESERLEELVKKIRPVIEFSGVRQGEDQLETYETVQRFMEAGWTELQDASGSHPSYVTLDEDTESAAERVSSNLHTEAIIENWRDIKTDYNTVARDFISTYEALYEHRHEVYSEAIQSVNAYAGDEVDEEDLDSATAPLRSRQGGASIELSLDEAEHLDPTPSLTRLLEHIQTVDSYERSAKKAVDELRGDPETAQAEIDLSRIFGSTVITEPEDLEEPMNELREEVERLLEEEDDVEIRFLI